MKRGAPALSALLLLPMACAGQPAPGPNPVTKESIMPDDVPVNGSFDRNPPPAVPAIVRDGKRYTQRLGGHSNGIGQAGGVIDIINEQTGVIEATIKVYDNRRDPGIEGDVQDIYFTSMAFDAAGLLIVTDEVGRRFAVDVKTRKSTPLP